jgi:hypothetical protein
MVYWRPEAERQRKQPEGNRKVERTYSKRVRRADVTAAQRTVAALSNVDLQNMDALARADFGRVFDDAVATSVRLERVYHVQRADKAMAMAARCLRKAAARLETAAPEYTQGNAPCAGEHALELACDIRAIIDHL